MSDLSTKYFGNGVQRLLIGGAHVVRTKEYHDLTPRHSVVSLPAKKDYVAYGWIDDTEGSFAVIRIAPNRYAEVMTKNLDYIRALPMPPLG